jgi:hypothetical protein
MKHTVFSRFAIVVAVAFLAAPALVHAEDSTHCSNATSAGSWGFSTNGVLLLPTGAVPVVAAGRFTQDIFGNLTGSQVRSLGGGVARETFTGTVTTNPDCTAKYTITVYDDSGNLVRTSVLDAVFTNNGKKAHVLFESIVLPNGASLPSVLSIEGEKQ